METQTATATRILEALVWVFPLRFLRQRALKQIPFDLRAPQFNLPKAALRLISN